MTARSQVILVAIVCAIAALVDFYQRVYVGRHPSLRDAEIATSELPGSPLPLAAARQRMQSWLPAPQVALQAGGADASQAARNSSEKLPDRGDLSGWRFVLRGVFERESGAHFAALEVMPTAGGNIERHDVSAGQTIRGVRVERISRNTVRLVTGEDQIDLALFVDQASTSRPGND